MINIKPLGFIERLIDFLFIPIMYVVAGNFMEKPQQTHLWNRKKLSLEEVDSLDQSLSTVVHGVVTKVERHGGVRFHMPIIGGWRDYVVLSPENPLEGWYVGWHTSDNSGVSRIKLSTPVRMLISPSDINFFAFSNDGGQISIKEIGRGKVGDGSDYSKKYPLL